MAKDVKVACCRNCGERVSVSASVCEHCGSELKEFDIVYKEKNKSNVGKVLGILLAVISVFVLIFVAGYFFLFTGENVFYGEYYEISYKKDTWLHLENNNAFYYVVNKMSSSFLIIDEFYSKTVDLSSSEKREELYLQFEEVLSSSDQLSVEGISDSFLQLHDSVYYAKYEYEQSDAKGNFYFLVEEGSKKVILFKTFITDDFREFDDDFMMLLKEVKFS